MTEEQMIRAAAGQYYDAVQLHQGLELKYWKTPEKDIFCDLQVAYKVMKDAEANLRYAQRLST